MKNLEEHTIVKVLALWVGHKFCLGDGVRNRLDGTPNSNAEEPKVLDKWGKSKLVRWKQPIVNELLNGSQRLGRDWAIRRLGLDHLKERAQECVELDLAKVVNLKIGNFFKSKFSNLVQNVA